MPFRVVESVAAGDSVAMSAALVSDFEVDCLAFGKKFRRGLRFETGDEDAVKIFGGAFSNSAVMVTRDVSRFKLSPMNTKRNPHLGPSSAHQMGNLVARVVV